jgi:hypothetical protein
LPQSWAGRTPGGGTIGALGGRRYLPVPAILKTMAMLQMVAGGKMILA